ncbi:hydrogenase accessory protein [Methylosinus sp. Ce-a6]|uniref:hydrogenase accessory protein n=1 Tax=Methylosinus sp. Ce-a6 TaxID=2172005 RepID=UPI00135AA49B|nr:hydrogenase accessory protein [Methylosinus sp. Ce-a6]
MSGALQQSLSEKTGLALLDADTIDAFLAPRPGQPAHTLLFFGGDAQQRSESHDVAIIFPQLIQAFAGRLRAAIVAPAAEKTLEGRFSVCVYPSLVVTYGRETLGVLPKVYDWADYLSRIDALLQLQTPPAKEPRVRITFTEGETSS